MTRYRIAYIPRGPDGQPERDPATGQLILQRQDAGHDLEGAIEQARQTAYAQRTGARVEQGDSQLLWLLWVPSTGSVEEIEPGTMAAAVPRMARRRIAADRAPIAVGKERRWER